MCGGTCRATASGLPPCGLSPRVRGNPESVRTPAPPPGSIPACAGEPQAWPGSNHQLRVYPRVCGGTANVLPVSPQSEGLSPRVRGNRPVRLGANPRAGSIPACAGEPHTKRDRRNGPTVYPRVCGGTNHTLDLRRDHLGLSPRVRGNHSLLASYTSAAGSIPACAGEPSGVIRV